MKSSLDYDIDLSNTVVGVCLNPSSAKDDLNKLGGVKLNIPLIMSGIKKETNPKTSYVQTGGTVCFKNDKKCRPPIKSQISSSNYVLVKPKTDKDKKHVLDSSSNITNYMVEFELERMLEPRFFFT